MVSRAHRDYNPGFMPLVPGTKLGPYEILSRHGAGGMGIVYRARDTRLDRTVAVKVLPEALCADAESRKRFEREARAISSLSHPHICALYDIGHHEGIDFLVMEFLEGETLGQRLERGPLPLDALLTIAIQIAGALDRAHRQGLTHRDLKPGNIMLTKSGAKLLDFGLAKKIEGTADAPTSITASLTEPGSVLGTIGYMSPEQLEGKEADARSDLFAFGAVLYEMATGRRAFAGDTKLSLASAILKADVPPLLQFRTDAPPPLDRLVRKCLEKNPEERWQSAYDLKLELEWMREAPAAAASSARPARRQFIAWAIAALAVIAALATTFLRPRGDTEPQPLRRSSILPPEGVSFAPFHYALSPDGTRLAFVGIGPDGRDTLWIRALDSRVAQQINDTEHASYPFWAPDNRRVGFFVPGKLKIADTFTGAVQSLCDAMSGRGGTWNRQGVIVFSPAVAGGLLRISENGGQPEPATHPDPRSPQGHRWPWFLPDQIHFLYSNDWSLEGNPHVGGLYAGSLEGGEPKLILAGLTASVRYASGHLLYFQGGSLIAREFDANKLVFRDSGVPVLTQEIEEDFGFHNGAYTVSESGVIVFQSVADSASRLVWYDRSGKELGTLPAPVALVPTISPNGRFVAVASDDDRNSRNYIRVFDLARGLGTRLSVDGTEYAPVWSRDGRNIFFASLHGEKAALYRVASDGSGKPELLHEGVRLWPNDVTPDGQSVVVMNFGRGSPYLCLFDLASRQIRDVPEARAEGVISPDGKWLANIELPSEVYVRPFGMTGARVQISNGGGGQPRWGRDGKHLFYIAPNRKLMEVTLEIRGGQLVPGSPRALFQTRIVAPRFTLFQYDVTADMNRFLVNSLRTDAPLTLLANWTSHHR